MPPPEPSESGAPGSERGGGDPDRDLSEGPPPARIPPPPGGEPTRYGISRAWQSLTPAGQWVIVLVWVAVFAAAVVGFGMAFSGDDGGGTATQTSATAPEGLLAPPPITTVVEPVPAPPETIIEEPPVVEPLPEEPPLEVPPVTEVVPEDPTVPDPGALPPASGEPTFEFADEGAVDLGELQITQDSVIRWTNVGGEFRLSEGDPGAATVLVNQVDSEGEYAIAAGTHQLRVEAGGSWTVQIIPS